MNAPWHLLDSYFDGDLTSEEKQQLEHWLAADAEHVRVFVEEAHLHYRLRKELLANRAFAGIADLRSEATVAGTAPANAVAPDRPVLIPGSAGIPAGTASDLAGRDADAPRLMAGEQIRKEQETFPKANAWRTTWKTSLALAAGITLLAGPVTWLFPRVHDEATLALRTGAEVTIERGTEKFTAQDGTNLRLGDILLVGGASLAAITYAPENTRLDLQPGTTLKLLDWAKGKRFDLRQGRLEASVARQRPFKPLFVRTPNAEARVLGTKFTLMTTNNATHLNVSEGKVRLTSTANGARVDVSEGHYTIAATGVELAALPQTGSILREYWTNFPGKAVNDLLDHPDYPDRPNGRDYVDLLEVPALGATNYGCRLVGYLHPPVTGQYIFWIAASPAAAVNLSPDENPANAVRIFGDNYDFGRGRESQPREWERKASSSRTHSQPITLVAGRRYYIEAVHKADDRGGHLAIAWTPPGGEREIIGGKYLSPLKPKR